MACKSTLWRNVLLQHVHCAAHSLNLCLVKAAKVQEIRAAITLMHEIAVIYRDSNKRLLHLQQFIDSECPESDRTRLKKHCTARWVEKQEAVLVFRELYPEVQVSLKSIASWPGDSGNKAAVYIRALDGGLLVAIEVLDAVMEVIIISLTKLFNILFLRHVRIDCIIAHCNDKCYALHADALSFYNRPVLY
jgi:hypothetical protein